MPGKEAARKETEREKRLKKLLLDRKRKMWMDLRDEFFRKLGKEYNSQFENPHDIEELALLDIIEDMGITVAEIRRKELEDMDTALSRLEDGAYGVCGDCGEDIGEDRLKTMPYATFCVACQGKAEKPR